MRGDDINDPLNTHDALRAAESAEGRVGNGVGPATVRANANMGQVIAVIGVEHRPVTDRRGQIRRHAAQRRVFQVNTLDKTLLIETNVIADAERMAFTGTDHVVVTVQP